MSKVNKFEALTKAGILGIGVLLVTTGITLIERDDTQIGFILVTIGVLCVLVREVIKPYFEERR